MTGVNTWSTTASENVNANIGYTWDEGMSPASVNNSARSTLADVRSAFNDLVWFQYGVGSKPVTATYASGTSITLAGGDATTAWHAGRRVKATGSSTGTIYGKVSSSSYSPTTTTVNFTWDSGSLSNEALTVYLSQIPVTGSPLPPNAFPLTSAHILVGNGSNVSTDVAASGDVSLANTGAFTVATATALRTARTIAITGDMAYTSGSFDGSGNVTGAGTLATVNSNVGSFTAATITVNGKGLVTAASASGALIAANNFSDINSASTARTNLGVSASTASGQPQQMLFFSATSGTYSAISSFGGVSASRTGTGTFSVTLGSTALVIGYVVGQASENTGSGDGIVVCPPTGTMSATNTYTFHTRNASSKSAQDPDRVLLLFY